MGPPRDHEHGGTVRPPACWPAGFADATPPRCRLVCRSGCGCGLPAADLRASSHICSPSWRAASIGSAARSRLCPGQHDLRRQALRASQFEVLLRHPTPLRYVCDERAQRPLRPTRTRWTAVGAACPRWPWVMMARLATVPYLRRASLSPGGRWPADRAPAGPLAAFTRGGRSWPRFSCARPSPVSVADLAAGRRRGRRRMPTGGRRVLGDSSRRRCRRWPCSDPAHRLSSLASATTAGAVSEIVADLYSSLAPSPRCSARSRWPSTARPAGRPCRDTPPRPAQTPSDRTNRPPRGRRRAVTRLRPSLPLAVWLALGAVATVVGVVGSVALVLSRDGLTATETLALAVGLTLGTVIVVLRVLWATKVTTGLQALHAEAVRRLRDPLCAGRRPPGILSASAGCPPCPVLAALPCGPGSPTSSPSIPLPADTHRRRFRAGCPVRSRRRGHPAASCPPPARPGGPPTAWPVAASEDDLRCRSRTGRPGPQPGRGG